MGLILMKRALIQPNSEPIVSGSFTLNIIMPVYLASEEGLLRVPLEPSLSPKMS